MQTEGRGSRWLDRARYLDPIPSQMHGRGQEQRQNSTPRKQNPNHADARPGQADVETGFTGRTGWIGNPEAITKR